MYTYFLLNDAWLLLIPKKVIWLCMRLLPCGTKETSTSNVIITLVKCLDIFVNIFVRYSYQK